MKLCPVCSSRCYDDMPVCYGCLHDFSKDEFPARMPDSDMEAFAGVEEAVAPAASVCTGTPACPEFAFDLPAGRHVVLRLEIA